MRYSIRDGAVLTSICDQYLIVSGKKARVYCPYILQINDMAASIWKMIESNLSEEEIIDRISEGYDTEEIQSIKNAVNVYISQLFEYGYLLNGGQNEQEKTQTCC